MKYFFFVFLFFIGQPLQAANVIGGESYPNGSKIEFFTPIGMLPSGGFLPVRVEVTNGGQNEMKWVLDCDSSLESHSYAFGRGNNHSDQITASFSVSCEPGEMRKVDLLIPIHQRMNRWNLDRYINIAGRNLNSDLERVHASFSQDAIDFHIGMSADLLRRFKSKMTRHWSSRSGHRYGDVAGAVDVGRLPEDWRAYSGYDALVLSRQDYLKLAPGAEVAIEQWVQSGGHLILLNDQDAPPPEFKSGVTAAGFGRKSVMSCGPKFDDFKAKELISYLKAVPSSMVEMANGDYASGDWSPGQDLGSRSLQASLLLLALVVFAIVVGPVNLFVWANKYRRHRLFVTTPIISIIGSLVLVAFIVFQDGFGGDGSRAVAIDVGGPDDKSAAIVQEQFSRSGILFSSKFKLNDESVLIPVRPPATDFNRGDSAASRGAYSLEMSRTKEGWGISGNLFESRSEQAQLLRSVIPSRERLELLSGSADAPKLVSSFSYPLTQIYYTDRMGKVWKASEVLPGEMVSLSRSSIGELSQDTQEMISRFGDSYQTTLGRLVRRRNSFAAMAEEAPAIATHTSIDWKESPTLITGLLSQ